MLRQLWVIIGVLSLVGCATLGTGISGALNESTASVPELLAGAEQAVDELRYAQAARYLVRASAMTDDEQIVEQATQQCFALQQLSATLEVAQRWLKINPTNLQAREYAALSAIRLYQVEVAAAHLRVLLDQGYITPAAGFLDWLNKLPSADDHAAVAVMKTLAISYPNMAEAQYAVARLAELTDDFGLMAIAARRAQELAPYWSPAGLLLAKSYLLQGQSELAIQTGQAVVKNDDSLSTRSEYAGLLLSAGKPNEALQLWRELEQSEGDHSAAVRALAYLDIQVGNYQSAFNRLNTLLNEGNRISESIFYLAGIAERTGAKAEARQLYGRVQDGQFALPAQLRIAYILKESDGLDAAMDSLKLYGEANPDELIPTFQARAALLSEAADDAALTKFYDQGIRDYPEAAVLQMDRAFHLLKIGKVSDGIQTMRELLKSRPEDPIVLNGLGYTLLDHSHEYQEALRYIEAAYRLTPDSAAVMDSMGWALFKLGKQEEALMYLQKASSKMRDEEVDFHLGEVLWALGRNDEALKVWQSGLEASPDNKTLQQRIKRATESR
jgi:tetratricopeptide (TPR) repeat protein